MTQVGKFSLNAHPWGRGEYLWRLFSGSAPSPLVPYEGGHAWLGWMLVWALVLAVGQPAEADKGCRH